MSRRKIAYVFVYRNGIRERSIGVLRCYGAGEQPEVVLELYEKEARNKPWRIYYFNRYGGLTEATFLWEATGEKRRCETGTPLYRLCAEVAEGKGVLLLPESVAAKRSGKPGWPETSEYLCAVFDGGEVTEPHIRKAFAKREIVPAEESPCIRSAKKLMEEITKAAGGEVEEGVQTLTEGEVPKESTKQKPRERIVSLKRKVERSKLACLEELLSAKPSYRPCREANVGHSVRILPSDLLCLSKEGRDYAENSFLMHGYYRYQHLLLGRRVGREREEYVLLVPGRYEKKESQLAKVFGFPEFLPVRPETDLAASGEKTFGYWCGKI